MKRYIIEVNVNPEYHNGQMAHMWQIILITDEGKYTVAHGWHEDMRYAMAYASDKAKELELAK